MKKRPSLPLPRATFRRPLADYVAHRLPQLRAKPPAAKRYEDVTLLIYCFTERDFTPFEFALRQTWDVLGMLPTVIVTHRKSIVPEAFARAFSIDVQEESRLIPGNLDSMSEDCLLRLHTRFHTRHVLIVQDDGWPMKDTLSRFLKYDYIGAPNVNPGWRSWVSDALCLTVLNGGFSLRSRRLCRTVAGLWKHLPHRTTPPEDRVYTRLRWFFRFPSAATARQFSLDCLDGLLPPAPDADPMGFHRDSTFLALYVPQPPLTVVSVVRDHACYQRCVRDNPHLQGARFVCFDNTQENLPIPERYNAFLDTLPPDTGWILFAHEDFEVHEDPRPLLQRRNPLFPLGLIGTRIVQGLCVLPFGAISDSYRDGSDLQHLRTPLPYGKLLGEYVENFDCCGFFVHAEAFRAWGLRFDPHCAWDLYAEDLCFQLLHRHGQFSAILPIKAQHWSRGNPKSQRFLDTLNYLNHKYADDFFAGGTCAFTVGKPAPQHLEFAQKALRLLCFWHKR